jgi:protein involved in polysaccharide export with SLBB domain
MLKAQQRADIEKGLLSDRDLAERLKSVESHYQVGCPDVLEIEVDGKPDLKQRIAVGTDGRLDLGAYGSPRVEGHSPAEIAELLAEPFDISANAIKVTVAEYHSQRLMLFGQVEGWQRSVPYQGQETVLDLLHRTGGITPGAEPGDVYVVRAHIAEGGRPEVYHVDLAAIIGKKDEKTNLRLMPNDQVYVGETRQARVERAIPPWFRPIYRTIWNTKPNPAATPSTRGTD